ncbi:hypothetical protein [Bradyrhizobium sp. 192]|uniref:hypothetical protein n=1 Tax=Bradyrhizobium sp. 192 TaxID=2782660 RepID=UPI0020001754|nr:hypothetical protein [Bradyrhizobium sp. 192]UPJ56981.1 hypothetical protein IVB24_31080 [Bradyrhizobium sp. 192]
MPAPAPFWDAGADFAGALDPPPLLSAGVFRLEAPAPGAPPVPEELMLEPVLDAPDPLWAPAVDVAIRAAPSASIVIFFMSLPPVAKPCGKASIIEAAGVAYIPTATVADAKSA